MGLPSDDGTTPELGLYAGPRTLQGSAAPPASCGIDAAGLPGACSRPSADVPCPVHSRTEVLRPIGATRSVTFRPRVFPTPRRLAPRQGCSCSRSRYRQGFTARPRARPRWLASPIDTCVCTAQHPKSGPRLAHASRIRRPAGWSHMPHSWHPTPGRDAWSSRPARLGSLPELRASTPEGTATRRSGRGATRRRSSQPRAQITPDLGRSG